ncbi:serine protease [Acinetobacter sp. VNH17]|uniref:Serine protease n=1 Tax=Acinetobacter thutiue TaxID=2998078 RepID=A0ABT7WIW8_9GAMM|nr:serine protease [Acinetobacter thutiue]MCY6410522.1 serine protease [Acinetobacter thutiue]MDN0012623.1 serine protease [Acinetobacter thutiue]
MEKRLAVIIFTLTSVFIGKEVFGAVYGDFINQYVTGETVTGDVNSLAEGIALIVRPTNISEYTDISIKIKGMLLKDVVLNKEEVKKGWDEEEKLCEGEPLRNMTVASGNACTAFLISENQVMTAGHCVYMMAGTTPNSGMSERTLCERMNFVFGVRKARIIDGGFEVLKSNQYKCGKIEKVVAREDGLDFAVIRLDRPVKNRTIFTLGNEEEMREGDDVFSLGHPRGGALSYTSGSVTSGYGDFKLKSNLDTFSGNSGSPVMNYSTNEVIGILIQGRDDFRSVGGRSCQELAKYDDSVYGETVLRMSEIKKYR